jgi:hypothetical protein
MKQSSEQGVLFPEMFRKPVQVAFDASEATSDGGALLLGALDRALGLTAAFAGGIVDKRDANRVGHSTQDLIRQRVFAIACGYEDANDAARLRSDPTHKLVSDRDPKKGMDLASQPTLSRFENSVTAGECFRVGEALAELVIQRHHRRLGPKKVRQITLDFDGSRDATHGVQQLGLFNSHFGDWCYFPLFGFITFNQEKDQYLIASVLRSGGSKEVEGTLAILRRLIPRLKALFPRARVTVRLDGGFQGPALLDLLDELKVKYMVGYAKNSVLLAASADLMESVRQEAAAAGCTVQRFGEVQYSAGSWRGIERRVIIKAECLYTEGYEPKDNLRYVLTNLPWTPRNVYQSYRGRGDSENRIKELKDGLDVDRTSCHRAIANQFRLLLVQAAYILYQELRLRAARTEFRNAQVSSLRIALIKIGGVVRSSVRRVVLHLSDSHPWIDVWKQIASRCGGDVPIVGT